MYILTYKLDDFRVLLKDLKILLVLTLSHPRDSIVECG